MTNQKQCRSRNQHVDGYKTGEELAQEAKEDERMDIIARNGNDGVHYESQKPTD